MLNNPKLKSNSTARNYPKFLNPNMQTTSKEKLYSNVPKTMHFNTSNKERQVKTTSMKIGSKTDSQGNRQININFFDKHEKQHQINTSGNNKAIYKVNSLNNFFNNNNTCESNTPNNNNFNNKQVNDTNQLSGTKLDTEENKANLNFKIVSEIANNNNNNHININTATDRNFSLKDVAVRNHSGTQRAKNSNSFREFSNYKTREDQHLAKNSSNKNYLFLLKEKEKEIENLKRELVNMKNIQPIKPTLSNDMKVNEHFLNVNPKSLSTSNKNNSKSIFKFDAKSNANEKVELFSDRSPHLKNMSNFNNFTNNFQNSVNLTNRNSFTSKNFIEILHNYNNLNNANNNRINVNAKNENNGNGNVNNNNLSNSANFASAKPSAKSHSSAHANQNQKNFSSTFSNFFRKSNKKNTSENSNSLMRDGFGKSKSSHKNLSKANTQTTSNPHINSNSNNTNSNTNHNTNSLNNNSNNMQILSNINYNNKNYSSNNNSNSLTQNYNNYIINNNRANDSNYNSERPSKKTNKNFNSNESNEFTSNFSDIVNFEDLNQIIKKPHKKENFISNLQNSNNTNANELRKKSSSRLEIGDLDVLNENNFRNLNNFSQKHSSQQMRNSTITSGKNLSNVTSYSQNEKEKNNNINNNSKYCSEDNTIKDKNTLQHKDGENPNNEIFERLSLLKQRTKLVLAKYAENFVKRK